MRSGAAAPRGLGQLPKLSRPPSTTNKCLAHLLPFGAPGDGPPCIRKRRTFAMAFSPCLEKSLSNAEITASLSLLREPRIRPAGLLAVCD